MLVRCPHCGNEIEVVSASEMENLFALKSERVQHLRSRGRFPDPWLSLENRFLYLRSAIEDWQREVATKEASARVVELTEQLRGLPEAEREEILGQLRALVDD